MNSKVVFYTMRGQPPAFWLPGWLQQQQCELCYVPAPDLLPDDAGSGPFGVLWPLREGSDAVQTVSALLSSCRGRWPVVLYAGQIGVTEAVFWMQRGAFSVLEQMCTSQQMQQQLLQAAERARFCFQQQQQCRAASGKLALLSEREMAVAQLVSQGLSASQIARQLYISPRTAEAHKANIFKKLDIKCSTALVQLVWLSGTLPRRSDRAAPDQFSLTVTGMAGGLATTK